MGKNVGTMKKTSVIFFFLLIIVTSVFWAQVKAWPQGGCTTTDCHEGILDIVPTTLPMMQIIKTTGQRHGNPDGCVVCHGGNPKAKKEKKAHKGVPRSLSRTIGPKAFYPDPGAIWIAQNTCGVCHAGYVQRMQLSLMNTEAGKIQGNLHTFGIEQVKNFKVPWGNYTIQDKDGPVPNGTTVEYKNYMAHLAKKYPDQFPARLEKLPKPSVGDIERDPKLAAFTYQRQECQRCHIGVKGRQTRGDYRGMGCSACHMPYSNDGFYEGNDVSIDKKEPGHPLKHRIAGNRKTGGIPVETCNSCHNRGKRIGVSFQGLMESPYGSPFNKNGEKQSGLHGKQYRFVSDDLHHQMDQSREGNPKGGLICQDCHTSVDVHGDGNIHGTTLAQVEIECTDCHGTPERFAWELPLGFGDEFGTKLKKGTPRGVSQHRLMTDHQFGYPYSMADGFLVSARGNPLGNVVKKGDDVVVHSATGNDFKVPLLKTLQTANLWKDPSAGIAMNTVKSHVETLECYTCHASWAAQCYGCHVKIDYSQMRKKKTSGTTDWVASGNAWMKNGQTPESLSRSKLGEKGITIPGIVTERLSYQRWEDPVLGFNGEGRVSPLMPGCQVVYTVIGSQKDTLAHNKIALNPGEAVSIGQSHVPLAIDMAPVQPHTAQRKARTCESCHLNLKTAGLGIGGGTFGLKKNKAIIADLKDASNGQAIPGKFSVQIPAISNLDFDWSRIVTRDGVQLATVGTHWPLSRSFNKEELDGFLRTGVCIGCHLYMDKTNVWKTLSNKGRLIEKDHQKMMGQMLENFSKAQH